MGGGLLFILYVFISQEPLRQHVLLSGCGDLRQLGVSKVTVSMMTLLFLKPRGSFITHLSQGVSSALNLPGGCVCVCVFIHREFQTPYLLCDCHLLWLLEWIKHRSITVKNTKCSYPQSLQAQLVASIRPELLTCGRDAPPVCSTVWLPVFGGDKSGCPPSAAFVCTCFCLINLAPITLRH